MACLQIPHRSRRRFRVSFTLHLGLVSAKSLARAPPPAQAPWAGNRHIAKGLLVNAKATKPRARRKRRKTAEGSHGVRSNSRSSPGTSSRISRRVCCIPPGIGSPPAIKISGRLRLRCRIDAAQDFLEVVFDGFVTETGTPLQCLPIADRYRYHPAVGRVR